MYNSKGLRATFVGQDQKDEANAPTGDYSLVYMSPESMLAVLKMFRSCVYQKNLVCLVTDEAHCIDKW